MTSKLFRASLLALAFATPAWSADNCPERPPGAPYPWQTNKSYPGDEWAYLLISVDASGKPTDCKIGKHQFKPETGFWMCRAMMAQGDFKPEIKDGVAIATTVTRLFTVPGRARRMAEEKARKQYFRDHPEESSRCYPD